MAQFNANTGTLKNDNDTLYEVVMVAGQTGPSIYNVAGNLNASSDAFGRLRVSNPHTLFDNNFRYGDSERRWNTRTLGTASIAHDANEGLMELTVTDADGDEVLRQTDRVFSYQPGKSLLVMNTFTMAPALTNLRQRVGYFGKENGIYLEQDDDTKYLVKRSNVTGSIVNTRIAQANWNVDTLDGAGPSGVTLDLTKSQIFWMDIEWLGVGSVRSGFVIDGQFIVCHIFHHANSITGTYITTATLPIRYEITNTGATTGSSVMKQICSTVISEGGYNSIGLTRSASNPIVGKQLANDTDTPMISLRLRSGKTDAVVVPRELSFYGLQNTAFKYKIKRNVTLQNASWQLDDSASSVEYDLSADSASGGTVLFEGLFKGQTTVPSIDLHEMFNHSLQLTRQIIDGDSAGDIVCITIEPTTNNDDAIASLSWQER